MHRLKVLFAIVCLLAGTAAALLALHELTTAPEPGRPQTAALTMPEPAMATTQLVVAQREIRRGERLAADMLGSAEMVGGAPPGAFLRRDEVVGAIALDALRPGQLVLRDAVLRDPHARPGLSVLVPPGSRAVALRVNDEVAVGNFIRPDDRVDIQLVVPADQLARLRGGAVGEARAPESRILVERVRVLSVGEALTVEDGGRAVRMQNITVAVTPEQALVLALAKEVGVFYLALRHPGDQAAPGRSSADLAAILGERPAAAAPESAPAPVAAPVAAPVEFPAEPPRIRIIRGTTVTHETLE